MSADEGLLGNAYELENIEQMGKLYDRWAATYEKELLDNGYVTPTRCAATLARYAQDASLPVADLGCGTGLSGLALRDAGFTVIDGFDYSKEMLAYARGKTGVYQSLECIDLSIPLPFETGQYGNACATGVVNPGHAPSEAIRYTLDVLPRGGCFALSLNDHAIGEGFGNAVEALVHDGAAELVFEEYGEHIPRIDLRSTVYLLRKL